MSDKTDLNNTNILYENNKKDSELMTAEDYEMEAAFKEGVRLSVQEVLNAGNPVVKYDYELKKPYFLYPNGEKKYAY